MPDRETLPDPPPKSERVRMAIAFRNSPDFRPGDAGEAILFHIRAGRMIFKEPGKAQMTKTGFDYLKPTPVTKLYP
jgi:hypothetical protein